MMDENWVTMVMGSAVLLFAAGFVVDHYRREHRRAQLMRRLDHVRRNEVLSAGSSAEGALAHRNVIHRRDLLIRRPQQIHMTSIPAAST
ncbi:hypothetical protein [Paraburkholderia mimosarum]|uniref:hypothetical protein n=1 Tax=Paraburkholderia mimosarum TaxID=312026 RepID=UPI000566F7B7|nr:hypothetical protein [Paraburkholderia mimosarum]